MMGFAGELSTGQRRLRLEGLMYGVGEVWSWSIDSGEGGLLG